MIAVILLLATLAVAPPQAHRLVYLYAEPPDHYRWNDYIPHPADEFLFRRLQPRLERLFDAVIVAEDSPSNTVAEACKNASAVGAVVVSREDSQIGKVPGVAFQLRSCNGYPYVSIVRMAPEVAASEAEMANLWFGQSRSAADNVYDAIAADVKANPSAAHNFGAYGIYLADGARSALFRLEEAGSSPVRVKSVYRGGPADRAGLREDDEIATINGSDASLLTQPELDRISEGSRPITVVLRGRGPYSSRVRHFEPRDLAWYAINAPSVPRSGPPRETFQTVGSAKLVYVDGVNADAARNGGLYRSLYAQLEPELEALYGSRIVRYSGSVQGYGGLERLCRRTGAVAVISVDALEAESDWYGWYGLYSCDGWQWLYFRTKGHSSGDIVQTMARGISEAARGRMPDASMARNLLQYRTYIADNQEDAFFRVDKEPVDRSALEQMQNYGEAPNAAAAMPYLNTGTIFIESVLRNGPAYRAGLRPGDVLLSINDRVVAGLSLEQIDALIAQTRRFHLKIRRPDDEIQTLAFNPEQAYLR